MLSAQDASSVVQTLDSGADPANDWTAVLDHLEAGEPDWIALVPLLAPGTDAGTAKGLTITLSRALKANAPAILGLMSDGHYAPNDLCGDNDIEVTVAEIVQFIDAASVAVAAVLDPALRAAGNACLAQLARERVGVLVET